MVAVFFSSNPFLGTPLPLTRSPKSRNAINSGEPRTLSLRAFAKSTIHPSPPAPSMDSASTLYGVLGIPATATSQEIKKAYRTLARVFHPDVVAMNRKDSCAAEFIKIHAAYTTLSDPDKRANYDRDLIFRSPTMVGSSRPVSRSSGYPCRRNWETDQCW
ncbi:hypothetical protein Nepgr_004822 [Nepenthes gracilis]|uniref:J domain-containing protein n=1 Tax=Nepenthes gracilis TaxID=150966 RepID=A0AAD3XFL9_NEPGR|nr:hypothetical protein Nepgr_004822 [Nepenthes gracilis]